MEKQLIKVAKELNIGANAIVEFLKEKGFEIENKPIAKISDDMYGLLRKKFSDSIADKERADQLRAVNNTPKTPTPPPVEKPKVDSTLANIRKPQAPVVIDLKPVKPKVVAPEPPKPEPVVEEKPAAKVEPTPETKPAPPAEKRPDNNRPQQHGGHNNRSHGGQQSGGNHQRSNNQGGGHNHNNNNRHQGQNQGGQHHQRPKPVAPPPPPAPPVVEKKPEPEVLEVVSGEIPQLRGLKVTGKIDIDKFLQKEKEHDSRNRRNKRGGVKKDAPKPGTPANAAKPADGTAPKPPTTGGNNNADRNRAGKRKRKKPEGTAPTTGTPNTNGGQQGGQNRGGQNRVGQQGGPGNNANNAPRRGNEPVEISQQQIEAKIRETMSRLNIGGKNKGQKIRRDKRQLQREREEQRQLEASMGKLQVTEFISVSDLASILDVAPTKIITTCMSMGIIVSINQRLDAELIEVICGEFGHEVDFISAEEQVGASLEDEPDNPEDLQPRAPVVTIMGHVDHGKTSLLDHIRKANVASGEAGGITQHIGAYEVKTEDGRKITFLDTPGHEAFTAMRARGAKVTDVAIIIIAADDSIMPQTREAISHAQAAGVPMVFAINKIDKPGADPGRIKQELAQMNLLVEEWGGKYQSQDISAKKGIGISELMEKILLEAEILDLKANPDKLASGTIIEASLDKGRGYVSKMLVQTGTLKIGDPIVSGEHAGKVKAMFNERGKKVLKAGPSTPVLVLGLSGAPQAGERFKVMANESEAKEIANKRAQIVREQSARATRRISLDEIGRRLALGTFKELNLIVKGDMDGSVEALSDALLKQSQETVQVKVLHKAVGAITESDVLLASASDAIIVGFQVRPSMQARKLAEREGVEINTYSIIYEAINEIRAAIEGMLEPTKEENITGTIEVREVYKISKVGTVAGCYVQDGKVMRNNLLRVIRNGIVVYPVKEGATGSFSSLKRFKDDVKEVKFGFECGLTIDGFNDIQVGDIIEAYEIIEVKQTLK